MATASGFRSSPDTPRPRNDFSPASSSRRPWAEKLSSSSRGGQDAPALGEERKCENDEKRVRRAGKLFRRSRAPSNRSPPALEPCLFVLSQPHRCTSSFLTIVQQNFIIEETPKHSEEGTDIKTPKNETPRLPELARKKISR